MRRLAPPAAATLACGLRLPLLRAVSTTTSSCSSPPPPPLPRPWQGLEAWRSAPPCVLRSWGPLGPSSSSSIGEFDAENPTASASSLAELACLVLSTADPLQKSRLSHLAFSRWRRRRAAAAEFPIGIAVPPEHPARPDKPSLVSPKEVPTHKKAGLPLNAYMLHNLAHVELNAIDLAWDTVARFSPLSSELGEGFFDDFAHVADDESRHFSWCSQRLAEIGYKYGDMPAHNLLWRECAKSSGDVSARLAVIPLVQEARGLDAGPRLVQKLIGYGDRRSSNIVDRIAEEELAHVGVGLYWFLQVCQKLHQEPSATFKDLLQEYDVELKGPFNHSARKEAGLPREWYDGKSNQKPPASGLSEVHDRLALIVAMEKENSNSNA